MVVQFRNASLVIVAPTLNPKKIVAAFIMLLAAAIKQTAGIRTDFLNQVTPNIKHTIKGTSRR